MKKILIIDGHPNKESLNFALGEAYMKGAKQSKAEVKKVRLADLRFNPNLEHGYQKRMELEPDLLDVFELIKWADHLVWIYPVWWGGFPAIMKGFIDRLFLPGLTYQPVEKSNFPAKLLKTKTARIITTLDQPGWYYHLVYNAPSTNQLKKCILKFCGVKPVKVTYLSFVKSSNQQKREKWLNKIECMGRKMI